MSCFSKIERALFIGAELPQGFDAQLQTLLLLSAQLYEANTALVGNINDSVTSITVVNGAFLPTRDFPLLIGSGMGSERVTVRSRAGNVLTVTRSSSPASHTAGDVVSIPDTFTNAVDEMLLRWRDSNPFFLAAVAQRLNTLRDRS
ncbi:hypothetical protein NA78x_000353 [Anatilimnocola sp. NA78]|uniref:hypothetical protein n=1 Tax=Anatilimnocola sp. NA78 TaxID=3415683 RepID=UPI003CE591DD